MRNNMSRRPKRELLPEAADTLSEIESYPQDLTSFARRLNEDYETSDNAINFFQLDTNTLVYDIYQESYKDIVAPLSDLLIYDIIAMNALLEAVKTNSAQSQSNARSLINGFSDYDGALADLPQGLQLDKKRVVTGMPYQVRRLTAAVTPLRIADDFYEQSKDVILEEVQHTLGLTADEIQRVGGLATGLRTSS